MRFLMLAEQKQSGVRNRADMFTRNGLLFFKDLPSDAKIFGFLKGVEYVVVDEMDESFSTGVIRVAYTPDMIISLSEIVGIAVMAEMEASMMWQLADEIQKESKKEENNGKKFLLYKMENVATDHENVLTITYKIV